MSLDRLNLTSFQSLRRIVLSVLTVFIIIKLISSLVATIDRPQIQGKFELYQTNLVLAASEWKPTSDSSILGALQTSIVGTDFLKSGSQQYQNARESDVKTIDQLQRSLSDLAIDNVSGNNDKSVKFQTDLINKTISAVRLEIDRIDLRLGVFQTALKQPKQAIETWQKIIATSPQSVSKHVATSLIDLWRQPSKITAERLPQIETEINSNFNGWFRNRILHQLYIDLGNSPKLAQLDRTEQSTAKSALIALVENTVPRVILGVIGVGLIIFFTIRLLIRLVQKQPDRSIADVLLEKLDPPWTTTWDWEIVWQVFMLGFFFVGQFLLPVVIGSFIDPTKLTIQLQAIYVFTSYVLMSGLSLGVLYLSISSYLPLSPDWFKFKWKSNWWLWGIGGYLVATPIVIIVSFFNEQIWQGQGGSNPILQIVLEGKDPIALLLFFLTAAVAAPIFEEYLFRGFLLPSLTRYVPVWVAIGISALLFGVAHLSLSEILPLTTLGIILGVVYVRTRSLLASMLLHSLWNSSTLVSLYLLGSSN
jgi:uncharacterized protein